MVMMSEETGTSVCGVTISNTIKPSQYL